MKRTGLLYDERFLLHDTGPNHPEMPDRLIAALKGIQEGELLPYLTLIQACYPNMKWIENLHHIRYIMSFEEACLLGMSELGYPDNQICQKTYEIALLAVGGIIETAKMMMEGKIDNAFCAVRPPGHHAEFNKAMGFCYFNNVAIAARYLQQEWGVEKVGIIDFDVHHGNGTQHLFEHDPTVFYYSIHEHPSFSFPGSGREFEKGIDMGYGFTLNSPILPGQGDEEYKKALQKDLFPAFDSFRPDVIILSSGFDAHIDDEMSGINLSTECYSWMMERFMEMADKYSQGRILSILEGGYCLFRLPELIRNHVKLLLGM